MLLYLCTSRTFQLFLRMDFPSFWQIICAEADHTTVYGLQYEAAAAIEPLGDTFYLSSFVSDRNGEGVFSAEMSSEAVIGEYSRRGARARSRTPSENCVDLLKSQRMCTSLCG